MTTRSNVPQPDAAALSTGEVRQISALFSAGRFSELEAKARELTVRFPRTGFTWKVLGASLGMQGKDALAALERAVELLPEDAEAHNNLANALRAQGRYEEAAANCRRALELHPNFAEAHSNLGNALRGLGDLESAITSYHQALAMRPEYAEAHNGLGNALVELGQAASAVTHYRRALVLRPNYVEAHQNLGNALCKLGQLEGAIASFQQALQLRPRYAEAHMGVGSALLELGRAEAALTHFRNAAAIKPDSPDAYNHLGNALLAVGRADEATKQYRLALAIRPSYAEVHSNLGNTLLELGRLDEAVNSYRRALEIHPDQPETLSNLGNALLSAGMVGEARESCERAVLLAPGLAAAHYNLGNALASTGEPESAQNSYRRALQIRADYPEAHKNLAAALRQLGRADEAEASCRRALEIRPDWAGAMTLQADLLADRGHFTEAEDLYRRALTLQPTLAEAWAGVSRLRKMTKADEDWAVQAQRLADQHPPARDEAHLRYAIGKYFDDVQDFEPAFSQYQRANELTKSYSPQYDPQQVAQGFDRIMQLYDHGWFERARDEANPSERPVFVIGMPRSGTTLTEQILASHPAVFGAGELSFWHKGSALYQVALQERRAGGVLRSLGSDYLQLLHSLSPNAARVVDKLPLNFQHLGLIHAALPNARIIHLQRHPIDTCLSIYFQNFTTLHIYANDLDDLAHYYEQYRRLMQHWRALLPDGVMLEVPYEGLVEDQEGWTRKILKFVDLPWDARCLDFQHTARAILTASRWQARQPINRSSVQRWRHYKPFVGPLRRLISAAEED